MPAPRERTDYPELMRALGQFIQQEHLTEVCVVEFDSGWIISGLSFRATLGGFARVPVDYTLSHADVRALLHDMVDQRAPGQPERRRWLR